MNDKINGLVKHYVLWPELENDFQKNIFFAHNNMAEYYQEIIDIIPTFKSIETEIALFYITNQKLSSLRENTQGVLNTEDIKMFQYYQDMVNKMSKDIFTYITVCCIVEARHDQVLLYGLESDWDMFLSNKDRDSFEYNLDGDKWDKLMTIRSHPKGKEFLQKYLRSFKKLLPHPNKDFDKFTDFLFSVYTEVRSILSNNNRDDGYHEVANTFLRNSLNQYTIEEVLTYLSVIFTADNFENGFGGPAWANIAQHALNFANGKINSEMFVDQAFSLEHNNGNIFNKDFLYTLNDKIDINYHTDNNISSYAQCFSISFSSILLNSQHAGNLIGLLNLTKNSKKISQYSNEDIESFFHKMKKDKPNMVYDLSAFINQFHTIQHFYNLLAENITPIKKSLLEKQPHLAYEFDNNNNYFDLKGLFLDIANTRVYYIKSFVEQEDGYFEMLSYLHNNVFNPQTNVIIDKPFNPQVFELDNLAKNFFDKNLIGGKAWSLANMNYAGLPVPKAKVFTTDCCAAYYQNSEDFDSYLYQEIKKLDDYLIDDNNHPILCSIRSGAPVSMPGMMDTVLNVGIDNSNYQYFCEKMGQQVFDKCVCKFMELFCSSRLGIKVHFDQLELNTNLATFRQLLEEYNVLNPTKAIEINKMISKTSKFPLNRHTQIEESLYAVFDSWHSERAKAFRIEKGISHDLGTAAIVQQMVFGNLNDHSCTGVVFSRNCLTGENQLVGEFLPKAQGEDVVSGSVTPFPIEQFKLFNPQAYSDLLHIAKKLEKDSGQIQDIEFTVEDGKLYILQHRQAVCSPVAVIKLLEDKDIEKESLLKQIDLKLLQKSSAVVTKEKPIVNGLPANSGVLTGIIITSESDMIEHQAVFNEISKNNKNFGWIFYANLTSPEHMPIMNKTHGFITEQGGFTSHAAIIARSLNKPCIVGLGGTYGSVFKSGDIITLDGTNGKIWHGMQKLVNTSKLAKTAAKLLLSSNKVNLSHINEKEINMHIENINNQNHSWIFNLPHAKYVKQKIVKKDKFLNLSQRVALVLAREQKTIQNHDFSLEEKPTQMQFKF